MTDLRWILLVEDEEDHRLLVAQALQRMGSSVPLLEAGTGEQALAWMRRQAAKVGNLSGGLVILDLGLPGMSGFGVLQEMREVPELEHTPVVVITASQNNMDQDHAFNLGVRGFFQKPADFRQYQDMLGRVLALRTPQEGEPPTPPRPPHPATPSRPPDAEAGPPGPDPTAGRESDAPMTFRPGTGGAPSRPE